jgi:hypothetical protein
MLFLYGKRRKDNDGSCSFFKGGENHLVGVGICGAVIYCFIFRIWAKISLRMARIQRLVLALASVFVGNRNSVLHRIGLRLGNCN